MDRWVVQLAKNDGTIVKSHEGLDYQAMMGWFMFYLGAMSMDKRQYKVLVFPDG